MYRIRHAENEDFQVIVNFQLAMAMESEGLELDQDTLTSGVLAVFNNPQNGNYFVAEDDDIIIASMLITYEWSDWRNKNVYWFQSVYVKPEYRGKKVFRQMYNFIKDLVTNDSTCAGMRLYVDSNNHHAINVYHSLGMDGEHYKTFEWMKKE